MASVPLRMGGEWDVRYLRMVAISGGLHAALLGVVLVVASWEAERPRPTPPYRVELTDARVLGGALPAGAPGKDLSGGATVPAPPQLSPQAVGSLRAAQDADGAGRPKPEPVPRTLQGSVTEQPKLPPPPAIESSQPASRPAPVRAVPPPVNEATVGVPAAPPPKPVVAKSEPPRRVAPPVEVKPAVTTPKALAQPTPPAATEKPAPKPTPRPTVAKVEPTPARLPDAGTPATAGVPTRESPIPANPRGGSQSAAPRPPPGAKATTPGVGTSTATAATTTAGAPGVKPSTGTGEAAGTAAPGTAAGADGYAALADKHRSGSGGGLGGNGEARTAVGAGNDAYGSAGAPIGLAFTAYRQQVVNAVRSVWVHDPQGGLVAAVGFTIGPTGAVSSVRITQSSGNPTYDRSVLQAVQRATLQPPPAQYADQFRDFTIRFHSEGRVGGG